MSVLAEGAATSARAGERGGRYSTVIWTIVATVAAIPLIVLAALSAQVVVGWVLPAAGLGSFRVGPLATSDDITTGDALFPVVFFGLLLFVVALARRLLAERQPARPLKQLLMLEAACAVPVVVQTVLGTGQPLLPVVDSPVLAAGLIQLPPAGFFLVWVWLGRRRRLSARARSHFLPFLLLSSTMALAALGTVTGLRHALAPTLPPTVLANTATLLLAVGLAGAVAALLAWEGAERKVTLAVGFTAAALLTLPLLLPPLMVEDGRAVPVPGPDLVSWTIALTLIGILLVVEALIRHIWRQNHPIWFSIPSVAIAVFVGPLRATYGLPGISSDDFLFGDALAPFTLWLTHGQVPYADQVLPHGILLSVLPDAVNTVLNDGSAATLNLVFVFLAVVVAAIAHLLLRRSIGFGLATVAVLLMAVASTMGGDLLIGALLLWLLAFALRRPHALGLGAVGVLVNTVAILAYPSLGVVSAGLTLVAVGLAVVGGALSRSKADIGYALLTTAAGLATALAVGLSPLGPVVLAAIRQVAALGAGYADAFGTALEATWETPFGVGQLLAMTFVLGIFASMLLIWPKRRDVLHPRFGGYLTLGIAAVPAALAVVLLDRSAGRVEPSAWPVQLAAGSLLMLGLIVPGVARLIGENSPMLRRVCLTLAACLSIVILPLGQGGGMRSSLGMLSAPPGWTSAEAAPTVPLLGQGLGDPAHLAELAALREISSGLPPDEPVLNLSNRGALFGHLGWNNPIAYLAPYTIESATAEASVIADLRNDPPRYAFLGPGPQQEGGSLTLRTPMLARWVAKNYTPILCGAFTWATLGTGDDARGAGDLVCPSDTEPVGTASIPALWAASIGAPADLGLIPASWGARAGTAAAVAATVTETAAPDEAERQGFRVDLDSRAGTPTDLIALTARCSANPAAAAPATTNGHSPATLTWAEAGDTAGRTASFEWGAGTFLVPVDAYPEWSLAETPPDSVRLYVPAIDCPGGWRVQASTAQRSAD